MLKKLNSQNNLITGQNSNRSFLFDPLGMFVFFYSYIAFTSNFSILRP